MYPQEWTTVPTLPCLSIEETLAFWKLLGYTVTYYQNRPYPYGVIARGGFALHFYRLKGMQPAETYTGCLVMVADAAEVYKEFSRSLKEHTGRVPNAGLPRISRMKPGQTRFTVTDPSGNSVIFITLGEKDDEQFNNPDKPGLTALQKSIAQAIRFRDFKTDDEAAAKTLDAGLKRGGEERAIDIAQALLMRAELAREMNELTREAECYAAVKKIRLTKEEIGVLQEKLQITGGIAHFFAA